MKKIILSVCLMAGMYNLTGQTNSSSNQVTSAKDISFVKEAAEMGMMEVKLGEFAMSKATSKEVKDLAEHIVTDHTKANNELTSLAAKKKITLPTDMSKDAEKAMDKLKEKTGADFDKAYAEMMVKDHEKAVARFKKQSEKGDDADIKSWAAKTLPVLEHHLKMAKDINKTVTKK